MATTINRSKFGIGEWLDSISRGVTPTGKCANVSLVEDGEVVEITYSGGQNFGSGGYSLSSAFAGNEPEFVEDCEGDSDQFTSNFSARFRFNPPSVVAVSSGDTIGGGRDFGTTVYICASEAQTAEGSKAIRESRKAESEGADLEALVAYLKECWRNLKEWEKKYVRNGTCWDSDGTPDYAHHPETIRTAFEEGPGAHGEDKASSFLRHMPEVLSAFRRVMYHMTRDERVAFFVKIEAEYNAEVKAKQVAFAREQVAVLQNLGLATQEAWKLIKLVGASCAVSCFEWIKTLQDNHPANVLFRDMSIIARRSRKFYSASALARQFSTYGLEVPPGTYQQMVKAMRAAQLFGLIAKSIEITAR